MTMKVRVSKARWYALGGFKNSRCIRRMRGASWSYYILQEWV